MRVVFAAPGTKSYYGIPKYFYTLCKFLEGRDIKTTFILDSVVGAVHLKEISPKTEPIGLWPEADSALNTLAYTKNISTWLENNYFNYDIFHCSHVTPFSYLRNKERNLPVVFQPFGNEVFTLYKEAYGLTRIRFKVGQYMLRYCAKNCDRYISEGPFQASQIFKDFGSIAYTEVPVGIDVKEVQKFITVPKESRDFRILAVNSFIDYERMDLLVYSFKRFHTFVPESTLVIVGAGPDKKRVVSIIEKLGLRNSVEIYSNVPESTFYNVYATSDVFVYTGLQTDFIMGILEAMAASLPIVSVGQPWLIKDNGYYVEKPTSDNIAIALLKTYCDRPEGSQGEKSRELVKTFDMSNIADKFIEVYKDLLIK